MDGIVSSSPPPPPPLSTATTSSHAPSIRSGRDHRGTSSSPATSPVKKECLSFAVLVQERLRYVKALLLGQAKKMRSRNDREATEADLRAAKMQADATGDAEK